MSSTEETGGTVELQNAKPMSAERPLPQSLEMFCKGTAAKRELHKSRSFLISTYLRMKEGKLNLKQARTLMVTAKLSSHVFVCSDYLKSGGRQLKILFSADYDKPIGNVPDELITKVCREINQICEGIIAIPEQSQVMTWFNTYWTLYLGVEDTEEIERSRQNSSSRENAARENHGSNYQNNLSQQSTSRKRQLPLPPIDSSQGLSENNKRVCETEPPDQCEVTTNSPGITIENEILRKDMEKNTQEVSEEVKEAYAVFRSTSRNISEYCRRKFLGQGTFGTVYAANDKETNREVAIKSFKEEIVIKNQSAALQEVKTMQMVGDHPNIVQFIEVLTNGVNNVVSFAMEKMDTHLENVIKEIYKKNEYLEAATVRKYMKHLLTGLDFLHSKDIIHLDIKPANLLISGQGSASNLKIGDLGSSIIGTRDLPLGMQTRPFRSPEMLMDLRYTNKVDVWSAGCVFTGMLTKSDIFLAKDEQKTLALIFARVGTPNRDTWREFKHHEKAIRTKFKFSNEYEKSCLFGFLSYYMFSEQITRAGMNVIDKLLQVCPHDRPSCQQALSMDYFNDSLNK